MERKLAVSMFGQKRLSREGGIEIVVKELCTRMVRNGCTVTCYNRSGHHVSGAKYDNKTEYEGICQKYVPTIEKKGLAAVSSSFFAAFYSAFGKYDVVHIHAEGPAFFAWLPKLFGKKVVVTIHGIDWQREKWKSGFGSKFIRQGEKNAVKYADEIIVLSKGVQDYFKNTYGLSDFIVEILFTLILRRKSEVFVPSIKFVSREETKSTTNLGVLFFISQISALVLFTTDNLIISHFIGPADVTSYSMVNKLYTAGTAVFAMLVTPYWSRTSVAKSHDDYNLIKKGIREMQCLWGVGIVGVLVLMIVFKPLAKVWLQKELYYAPGLIPLMAIYSIIYMWNAIYSQVANGLSLMKVIVPVGIIQGIINIPLSLFFALKMNMGVVGVLMGTVLSFMVSAIVVPLSVRNEINIHIKESSEG